MTATGARVPAVHVALSGAAVAFVAVMAMHAKGGISEKEETRVFMLACLLVPITGVVVGALFCVLKKRLFGASTLFWPLTAIGNAAFWVFFSMKMRRVLPPPKTGVQVELAPVFAKQMIGWAALNVALLLFLALTRRARWAEWLGARAVRWVDRALPVVVFVALLPFTMHWPPTPWKVVAVLGVAGAVATALHGELFEFPRTRRARVAVDVLVLIAVYLLVMDPGTNLSPVRVEHHNFYLGPAAAVRAGKSVLVDVNCQYGVGNIYLLASLMRFKLMDASMFGLAHLIGALAFIQYAAFYGSLRMATRSVGLAALVTGVALTVATFEQLGFPAEYPSTGGIRFLPGYLLVFCIALKARFPNQVSRIVLLEAFIVGAASIWSFEAFVYVAVAYLGSVVYEVAHARRAQIVGTLRARTLPTVIAMIGWHVWLLALTRVRSGEWPHWSYYLAYIRLYSVQEFGTLPIEPWTPWLVIGGVYAAAITALGYRRLAEESATYKPELAVVFTMASLGIGQYTYFLGRSHFNNLFHICLPAFFVAGFMFIRAAKDVTGVSLTFRRWFVFVGYAGLILCFFSGIAEAASKFDQHTALATLIRKQDVKDSEPSKRVQDAVDLLRAHAANVHRVAFFSGADVDVQVYLLTRKASIYPLAYQPEDDLVPAAKKRALDFQDGLKAGDIVFIDTGTRHQPAAPDRWELATDVDATDKELWEKVEQHFTFEVVEERKATGVYALRLVAR